MKQIVYMMVHLVVVTFLIVETTWVVDLIKDNNALQKEKIALLNTVEDLENREIVTIEFVEEKKVEKPISNILCC